MPIEMIFVAIRKRLREMTEKRRLRALKIISIMAMALDPDSRLK